MEISEYKTLFMALIDPPGPGRIGGHYFHTGCPSVRHKNQKHATALKQNTVQRYMGPGGSR